MTTPSLRATGRLALHRDLALAVPEPFHRSHISSGTVRREEHHAASATHTYPRSYSHGFTPVDHLRFALRYEPLDLRVVEAAFRAMPGEVLEEWVRREATGSYARRAWFLYETLTGGRLNLPDTARGAYVPALNGGAQFIASQRNSPRHRVVDNLLGTGAFSVTVRRTPTIEAFRAADLPGRARRRVREYDPTLLARAITFLYTWETLSSFQIEREQPDKGAPRHLALGGGHLDPH